MIEQLLLSKEIDTTGANFTDADFTDADLERANLTRTNFIGAKYCFFRKGEK